MKKFDYLIVGAGLSGAMEAYTLTKQGYSCLVIEQGCNVGGMCYTKTVDDIIVHKHGAHIFHTSNKKAWEFVNSIVPFTPYINSPVAYYRGRIYNLPFNMNTFVQLYGLSSPDKMREKIEADLTHYEHPDNLEQQATNMVGRRIYETLIKGYTEKQWGRKCTSLPPEIISRIPLRFTFDNNYFNDTYQGVPEYGYTRFIEKLLVGSTILLGIDYERFKYFVNEGKYEMPDNVIYTGRIDEFYGYCYGKLEYRSVKFVETKEDIDNYQGCAVMNFTDAAQSFTRSIEHKHFMRDCKNKKTTIISTEFPTAVGRPCYPINDERNMALYARYKELADMETNVRFVGRLAEYKYYDMNKIIEQYIDRV